MQALVTDNLEKNQGKKWGGGDIHMVNMESRDFKTNNKGKVSSSVFVYVIRDSAVYSLKSMLSVVHNYTERERKKNKKKTTTTVNYQHCVKAN